MHRENKRKRDIGKSLIEFINLTLEPFFKKESYRKKKNKGLVVSVFKKKNEDKMKTTTKNQRK